MTEGEKTRLIAWGNELRETLRKLEQDHTMIAGLLESLQGATEGDDPPDRLGPHLEGIAAIMESHIQYEERQVLTVLDAMALDGPSQG